MPRWKNNSSNLPQWSAVATKILLMQPSSAAAERVFSLLKATFTEQQEGCLQDYIEASIMLQFNKHFFSVFCPVMSTVYYWFFVQLLFISLVKCFCYSVAKTMFCHLYSHEFKDCAHIAIISYVWLNLKNVGLINEH